MEFRPVAAEAACEWGQQINPAGLGDGSPPEAESFTKNMYKSDDDFKNLAVP